MRIALSYERPLAQRHDSSRHTIDEVRAAAAQEAAGLIDGTVDALRARGIDASGRLREDG